MLSRRALVPPMTDRNHLPQCPDFGQTGAELQEVIDHLFACTIDVAVRPFFARTRGDKADLSASDPDQLSDSFERLEVGGSRGLKEVLRLQVRKAF